MFDFMSMRWPRAFMLTATLQAAICLAFESYVFAQFQMSIKGGDRKLDEASTSQVKTIPTFLTLFIFAFLYQMVLVWDALRMKNTIQVIIICICNLAFLVFSAIQIEQVQEAVTLLQAGDHLNATDVWVRVRPFLIAIPCIIALTTLVMVALAWKLYQEFAWDILKHIGADYRMKKRFFHYQVYIALLKFDFFFFLGFIVQFLVIVSNNTNAELGVHIAALPVAIAILLVAAFLVRRENKLGMLAVITMFFCALAYFFFKLVRIYQPGYSQFYTPVKKSLTAFAVLTIILLILTIVNAFICMSNFNNGLKKHLLGPRGPDVEKPDLNSINLSDVKQPMPSRMTID